MILIKNADCIITNNDKNSTYMHAAKKTGMN